MPYKSSVLKCYDDEDEDCPICNFIRGDRDQDTLVGVIELLDKTLAEEEDQSRLLQEIVIALKRDKV